MHHSTSTMTSPQYNDISLEIGRSLRGEWMEGKGPNKAFLTVDTPEKVLTRDNLRRIYRSLAASGGAEDHGFTIDETGFIENVEKKKLHAFLTVLLFANCPVQAARDFTKKLVEGNAAGAPDIGQQHATPPYSLPARREYLEELFDNQATAEMFYMAQSYFSTVVIGDQEDVKIDSLEVHRLPWLTEELIGSGSFGKVYRVKIASGHFSSRGYPNKKPEVVARKDYVYDDDAEINFEAELEAMRKILHSTATHDNILMSLGTLEIRSDPPKFSIFMPEAEYDLEKYMKRNDGTTVADVSARARLIRSAWGLADGLDFLHKGMQTTEAEKLVCYHMDLKPSNILIFRDDRKRDNPHDDDQIWKVSDFGMSKVKIRHRHAEADEERDFRGVFRSNVKSRPDQASATRNVRGIGTYLPSEAENDGKTMDEKSDVWSLGCVLSVLFTYMEEGSAGLLDYSENRLERSKMDADVFYGRHSFRRRFITNPGVQSQHDKLIKVAGRRNSTEKEAVSFMLGFLDGSVLRTDKAERCDAEAVAKRLKETRDRLLTAQNPVSPERRTPKPRHLLNPLPLSWRISVKTSVPQNIRRWRLRIDKTMTLKGCESSPNGEFIAYWNDHEIMVFAMSLSMSDDKSKNESESGSRTESERNFDETELQPIGRRAPDNQSHSWKAVKLTNSYLIAVTTGGGKFNCYIFDIANAADLTKCSTVSLSEPEAHMLAISPDQKTLVCVLAKRGTHGSLLSATISQPCHISPASNSSKELSRQDERTDKTDAGIHLIVQKVVPLGWSASRIIDLMLRSNSEGYMVLRPENMIHAPTLSISLFSIQSAKATPAIFDPESSDYTPARTFTDMACFRSEPAVLVVVQTERVCKVKFPGINEEPTSVEQRIKGYRVLKIAMDEISGTVLALGTRSGNHNIVLLEINLPGHPGHSTVHEMAKLPGLLDTDELKLRIYGDSDEIIALVTAITPVGRHSVYQIVPRRAPNN